MADNNGLLFTASQESGTLSEWHATSVSGAGSSVRAISAASQGIPAIDGKEISRATITADYERGEAQTFTFEGAFDPDGLQTHRVSVKLLNDKWDGNKLVTTDSGHNRNLFVESVTINGVTKEPNKLITSGSAGWDSQLQS